MMTSEKVRVCVSFIYLRKIYCWIDLIAQCDSATGVLAEILSHLNSEMFT